MDLGTQLLFFISGLGVFNGLLMSLYFLLFTRPKRLQNIFFGLLVLMLSMRIGKSVFLYFGGPLPKVILQIGLSACFMAGPFLFFYIKSVLKQQQKIARKDGIHILSLLSIIVTLGLIFPYSTHPEAWNPEMVQFIYAVWAIYIVFAIVKMWSIIKQLFSTPKELSTTQIWLLVVLVTNVLICSIFHSILYLGFPSYIMGPITFSFVFYALLAFLLFFPSSKTIIDGEKQRYVNKKVNDQKANNLLNQLTALMQEKQLFLSADLKLKDVAEELQSTPHLLSQVLNDNMGKSFPEFVNEYRIEAACNILQSEHNLSIEGIAHEVGFRSKSTFYAAFKKLKGLTPSQFMKSKVSK